MLFTLMVPAVMSYFLVTNCINSLLMFLLIKVHYIRRYWSYFGFGFGFGFAWN